MMKKWLQKLSAVVLTGALAVSSLGSVVHAEEAKPFDGEKVKVGVAAGPEVDVWEVVKEKAKNEAGIDLEIVEFTDYNTPNVALADGSVDLNAFQHQAYLEDWNESNNEDLQVLGYTYVSPMGAYSEKYQSLDELQDGDLIAIPNDATNGGRAILALQIAGVIKVDEKAGALPTPNDITENKLNLKFEEADAARLPALIPDVAVAFVNTNYATDAGLSLQEDAIFVDADQPEQLNELYKNVIAVRPDNKNSELLQEVVKLYQSEEVAQKIYDTTNGGDRAIWDGAPQITGPAGEQADDSAEESESESKE